MSEEKKKFIFLLIFYYIIYFILIFHIQDIDFNLFKKFLATTFLSLIKSTIILNGDDGENNKYNFFEYLKRFLKINFTKSILYFFILSIFIFLIIYLLDKDFLTPNIKIILLIYSFFISNIYSNISKYNTIDDYNKVF